MMELPLSDKLAIVQTILSIISILISFLIFDLGIRITNRAQEAIEEQEFNSNFSHENINLSDIKIKNYKLFVRKVKSIRKYITIETLLDKLTGCIDEKSLVLLLKLAKQNKCIIWNESLESDEKIKIYNIKRFIRVVKKIYENFNSC